MAELVANMKPRVEIKKGLYTAKIADVLDVVRKKKDTGESLNYTEIHFALTGRSDGQHFPADAAGYIIKHSVPSKLTANSKLTAVMKAAGVKLQTGVNVDTKAVLVGKEVELSLKPEPYTGTDGSQRMGTKVTDVDVVTKR